MHKNSSDKCFFVDHRLVGFVFKYAILFLCEQYCTIHSKNCMIILYLYFMGLYAHFFGDSIEILHCIKWFHNANVLNESLLKSYSSV